MVRFVQPWFIVWIVTTCLAHQILAQDFASLAMTARAQADAEATRFAGDAGGGLTVSQMQSLQHGNRLVSASRPQSAASGQAARAGLQVTGFGAFAPSEGGGLTASQQQLKNHGNQRVSGERATRGRTFERTGRAFRALSGMSSAQVFGSAAASQALSGVLRDVCRPVRTCDASARFRTADGTCNNLLNPLWGSHDTPQPRLLPPAYQNGEDSPRTLASDGSMLPSPRAISNLVHRASSQAKFDYGLTLMVMQYGQFTDHDIVITPTVAGVECCTGVTPEPEDCFNINIPPGDPHFSETCMPLVRSLEAIATNCVPGQRQQTNLLTSYIDASNVYGSTDEQQMELRTGNGGLLRTSGFDLLPEDENENACTKEVDTDYCLKAGDERVSEQPILSTIHTAFLREHNYIASRLAAINPHWSDERLFQEARKIVAAEMQHITYNEYLPIILGPLYMWFYGLNSRRYGHNLVYSPNIDASIVNVFAASVLRFGHSQVPDNAAKATQNFFHYGHRNLANTFFKPNLYLSEPNGEGANAISRWSVSTWNLVTDREIQRSVQDNLFLDSNGKSLDLASLNIQRGRDHGLPPYNEFRALCGLPRVRHWGIGPGGLVHHSAQNADRLRRAYRSPDDIDIFAGALSERPVYGGLIGPTNACLLANQFRRLKIGDRFFYENPFPTTGFTLQQLTQIKRIRLSKIMCRNMNMFIIQSAVFRTPNFINRYQPCVNLPDIDLEMWRESNTGILPQVGGVMNGSFSRQSEPPASPLNALRLQNVASFIIPTVDISQRRASRY